MDGRQQREKLELELRRQGLPRAYIERLLAEWDDHLADLQDERKSGMSTAGKPEQEAANERSTDVLSIAQRLGDPAELAAFATKQYRTPSFLGRHPLFTFAFAPVLMLLLSWMGILFGSIGVGALLDRSTGSPIGDPRKDPFGFNVGITFWIWLLTTLVPLANVLFLCRVARRNAVSWRWAWVAVSIVSVVCASLLVRVIQPTNDHEIPGSIGNGALVTGLGFSTAPLDLLWFAVKLAVAMGIGMLLIRRAQRLQQIDESREELTSLRRAA